MEKSEQAVNGMVRTVGIGSLPFCQHEPARDHIARYYDIPYLPQIAEGDGDGGMLALLLPPKLNRRSLSGFGVALTDMIEEESLLDAFEAVPENIDGCLAVQGARGASSVFRGKKRPLLKAQIMGPISLLQTIRDGASRPLWSAPQFHPQALSWTIACAQAIAQALQPLCEELTLWLDEPMLGLINQPSDREKAKGLISSWNRAMKDIHVGTGLHCCSHPPFDLLTPLPPHYLSFDFLRYQSIAWENLVLLRQFVEGGGVLALGVLAPMAMSEDPDLRSDIRTFCQSLGIKSSEAMARHILLTPTCGTLLTPMNREVEIAKTLRAWSHSLSTDNV